MCGVVMLSFLRNKRVARFRAHAQQMVQDQMGCVPFNPLGGFFALIEESRKKKVEVAESRIAAKWEVEPIG